MVCLRVEAYQEAELGSVANSARSGFALPTNDRDTRLGSVPFALALPRNKALGGTGLV